MSFGVAARGRALASDAPCPCGAGLFGGCCGPALAGTPATTPVALMRSRYTAFALGDARYLLHTWHPTTAPATLELDDALRWEGLEIVRAENGDAEDRRGVVEFRAQWRDTRSGERGVLHEVSRFRRAAGRWYYLDG